MDRKIVAFQQDSLGDWLADLECGHRQHVRHSPPLVMRPWVITPEGRQPFIGTSLYCKLCESDDGKNEGAYRRQKRLQIASYIKAECLRTALEAYEYAKIKGLCHEGAWDYAIDATRSLDIGQLLDELPE